MREQGEKVMARKKQTSVDEWNKKTGKDTWINKFRDYQLYIEKGKSKDQYPYGVILTTYLHYVAGGTKVLKGFYKKSQALKFAKSWMKTRGGIGKNV
jgi:hypothetical protein